MEVFKLTLLPMLMLLLVSCTADLREGALPSDEISFEDENHGRGLLAAASLEHGLDAWLKKKTLTVVMRDEWRGLMTKIAGRPWNKEDLLKVTFRNGTFTSRLTFIEGDRKGRTIGIQSWHTYERDSNELDFEFKENDDTTFWLPAFQYFFEIPFRIYNGEIVGWIGEAELRGMLCDRVFVTWNKIEPHAENDQYIVWINQETSRVELVQYTVRDAFRFVTGEIRFEDYRDIEGVQLPFKMTVSNLNSVYEDGDDYIHQVRIESAEWDVILDEELTLREDIEEIGDRKR